jgi:SPP1 family phage portal protein
MLKKEEIKSFIDNDAASRKKQLAKVGVDYYEGKHDIKNYRIFFVNADGQLQEDLTKSNIRISHPFFAELVDQEVQYMLSGEDGFIRSDDPKLQEELDTYFNENEDFTAELYDILTGAVVKGFEYAYAYKNEEGRTCFQCADSVGVVEVRAKDTDDKCEYVIFWYIDRIGKDNKKVKRIQVWDSEQVHFFVEVENEGIVEDDSVEHNPRPHTLYKKGNSGDVYYESYGLIPFFRLDNNRKQTSGLHPIKDIVDDYDLMNAGLSNNIQDTNEALYVVKGFSGDNLDELMLNIKAKKHVGVDEDGGVEVKTIDIPYEARRIKMEIDENNVFRFGMGVNTEGLKDTSATTSIAIKSAYALLDLKCNKLEIRLKQFMRKLLEPVLAEINELNGTDYRQKDVYFKFDREIITNAAENAQIELTEAQRKQTEISMLLDLASHIGNEVLMEQVFEVLDLNYEDYKDKIPVIEEPDPYSALNTVQAAPAIGGDMIE